jgi:hypothetical protein
VSAKGEENAGRGSSWSRRAVFAAMALLAGGLVVLFARSPTAARAPSRVIDLGSGGPRDARADCVGDLDSCEVRSEVCQHEVFRVVQCLLRESSAKETPRVRIVGVEEMRALTEEGRAKRAERLRNHRRWLSWLRLDSEELPEEQGLPPQGHYAFQARTIYLSDVVVQSSRRASLYVLAHEMIHALQDEVADLSEHRDGQTLDEGLAERAVLEGEAYFHEEHLRNLVERRVSDGWRTGFAEESARADQAALAAPFPVRDASSLFERPHGIRFAAVAFAEDQAGSLARRLPLTTRTLLERSSRATGAASRSPEPCALGKSTHDGRLGAWLTRLWFARSGGSEHAKSLNLPLSSESYRVCEASDARTALVWRVGFATEPDATLAASRCGGPGGHVRCVRRGADLAVVAGPEQSFVDAMASTLEKDGLR